MMVVSAGNFPVPVSYTHLYEGEASYTDTLTRHLIPTQSTFLQLNA